MTLTQRLVLALLVIAVRGVAAQPVTELDEINPALVELADPPNLETPQACVENFVLAARNGDLARAARSLNFRLIADLTEASATTMAEQLFFVLNQELWIDWEALPDRADGMVDRDMLTDAGTLVGEPRSGIRLGSIAVDGRQLPIRLERVKTATTDPVWLFSAQTVENIEVLYDAHGPGWLDRHMPEWARARGWQRVTVWKWIVLGAVFVIAPLLGWFVVTFVKRSIARVFSTERQVLARFDWPIITVVTAAVIWANIEWTLSLPSQVARIADPVALIVLVGSLTWLVMRIVRFVVDSVAKDAIKRMHDDDSKTQRRILTQVTVARHVLMLVVALTAVGIVMVQLGVFRTFGIAMLSSAGAAAVILGIAGQAVLGNLIAGLQIAMTQPFTLGDAVYIEGNWGRIEDITYTYVVVHTWDKRRLVFPIKYFIDNWFENWSMTDPFLVKPIYLHVDYRADVEAIRARFMELLKEDEDWDRENDDPDVLVTDTQDETMVVRLTCGGANSSDAWYLHCRIREKLVAWLQQHEHGRYLPRRRVQLDDGSTAMTRDDGNGNDNEYDNDNDNDNGNDNGNGNA